jgi:hypothetical protein
MGRSLFEPRCMRLGHDQHRQTQSVQHPQDVLEIDALAILLDSMPTETPQCLAAWSQWASLPLLGWLECGRPVGEWCESSRATVASDQVVVAA